MNKIINCKCPYCNKIFTYTNGPAITIFPCQHIIHKKCFYQLCKNKTNKTNKTKCMICNKRIKYSLSLFQLSLLQKNINYKQCYIDLLSVSIESTVGIDYIDIFFNLPNTLNMIFDYTFYSINNNLVDRILTSCNINIFYKGMNNINKDINKVFICNHQSSFDAFAIYRLLNTGFVASASLKKMFGSISKTIPILYTDRRKGCNTTDKIKEHINKHGSICIFPEGLVGNSKTLLQFRTGAFNVGYPVQPLLIRYSKPAQELTDTKFALNLLEGKKLDIFIDILPIEEGPFDEQKINTIREKMASYGNLMLSRASNRDMNVM